MNMYTIKDGAADFFITPFFAKTDAQATRMFISSLGDSFPYRRDYTLFKVAIFDDDTGTVTGNVPSVVLAGHSIDENDDPRPPLLQRMDASK